MIIFDPLTFVLDEKLLLDLDHTIYGVLLGWPPLISLTGLIPYSISLPASPAFDSPIL
jgi:hypothetical protein